MAESCKYCEAELSPMDAVYIESEIRTAPQKVQNIIASHHNIICYNCFKRLKNIRIVNMSKKGKREKA